MEKFEISVKDGLAYAKFPHNLLKANMAQNAGFSQNRVEGFWSAGVHAIKPLVERIRQNGLYMSLDEIAQEMTSLNEDGRTDEEVELRKSMWKGHASYADTVPEEMDFARFGFREDVVPYPYQWAGMDFGVNVADGRVLIADDMGLGKTLQAIGLCSYYKDDLPLVAVVPASLLYQWKTELLKFLDWLDDDDITIIESGKDKPSGLVSICTYDYVTKHSDTLINYMNSRGILLFDEAHALKSMESLRGAAGVNLAHYARRCFMITGTPILNRPIEIYPLIHALDPISWDDEVAFARKYCEGHEQRAPRYGTIWYDKGAANLDTLMGELRNTLMFRRMKIRVLDQLPKKTRRAVTLNATNNDRNLDEFAQLVKDKARPILISNDFNIASTVERLRGSFGNAGGQVLQAYEKSALNKIPNIVAYVLDQMDSAPEEPILIFAHHDKVLSGIQDGLLKAKKDLKYIRIDGSVTNKKKRFEMAKEFQEDDSYNVAFLTLGTGSVGLNLTRARKAFVAQMAWSTSICIQAEDRINRIGQENETEITYMLGYNGFDDYMWSTLVSKSEITKEALDGHDGEVFEVSGDIARDADVDDILRTLVEAAADDIVEELKMAA